MKYHYGEGWVTFYYRFSMSAYESERRNIMSFFYNSANSQHTHYLEIRDWLDASIGIEGTDWYCNFHDNAIFSQAVWFGFHKKSHAELFKMVWG